MKNIGWKILALVIIPISWSSCYKRPPSKTKAEVMQERLDGRLERWKQLQMKKCRDAVFEEATAIVDSTFLADARLKRDTSDIPDVPGRPDRPEFVPPEDSTPIAPLLEEEEVDTLPEQPLPKNEVDSTGGQ